MADSRDDRRGQPFADTVQTDAPQGSLAVDLAGLATLLELVAATPTASPYAELPPGLFADGAFEIERTLGSGGMGVVYLARDTQLDRQIAIKLPRSRGGAAEIERMRREATAMARLSHPNVVRVYEVDTVAEQLFIVMEYMSGGTLRRWLRDRRPKLAEIVDVFVAVGQGLVAAHDAGIAHRDFKPDNVFMAEDGRPCVADFGLARGVVNDGDDSPQRVSSLSSSSSSSSSGSLDVRLTATGATLGTPRYMAPEQFDGGKVDARADQFSFCVALYEAVNDQHPFGGDSMAELRERVRAGVVLPPRPDRSVPAWLRRILVRGLSVKPSERFADMASLLAAIRGARSRRRSLMRYGAAAVALAAVAGGAFMLAQPNAKKADVCTGAAEHMVGVWDDIARDQAKNGVLSTKLDHAPAVWKAISGRVDGYRDDWVKAHTKACVATRVRQERSERAMDASMLCLSQRRAQLLQFGALLGKADRTVLARAVTSVDALGEPSDCLLELGVKHRLPPRMLHEVRRIRHEIGTLAALVAGGNYAAATPMAETLVQRARSLGFQPLLAQTLYNRALLERHRNGPSKRAVAGFEEAFNVAYATGFDLMVAQAVVELTLLSSDEKHRRDADRWFKTGLAAVKRIKSRGC